MRAVYAAAFERHWDDAAPGHAAARAALCAFETAFVSAMSTPSADKEDPGEGGEEGEEEEEGEAAKGAIAKLCDYLVACGGVHYLDAATSHPCTPYACGASST